MLIYCTNEFSLQEWVTATAIRISLTRMNTFGDEVFGDARVLKSYFFAISDLSVGARYFTTRWKQFKAPSHPYSSPFVKKKYIRKAVQVFFYLSSCDCLLFAKQFENINNNGYESWVRVGIISIFLSRSK